MREFELAIDEAFIKGLRPELRMRRGTPVLTECLGFRIGKYSIEGAEYYTDPIPTSVTMYYSWPFPQFIKGERYRFLIVRDDVNMEDVVYFISADYSTATEIFAIDELIFGQGTLMEVADFAEYAFMTNGVIMIYWDTTLSDWHEIVASATIPMMRTVCNFKGQMIGGCVLSAWYDCNETFVVWSRIGSVDFTPGDRNEAGFRRDPFGGEVYHVRRLGSYAVIYSSEGITKMIPVSAPAATFGFEELHDVGLINRGAMAGNLKEHLFVDADHYVWRLNEGGLTKLGYREFADKLDYGDILVHHDINKGDFYISSAPAPLTTAAPTTLALTTLPLTTLTPTTLLTTSAPTTSCPTTVLTTAAPTTTLTTLAPTTLAPTTAPPTTLAPTTMLTTVLPTTGAPVQTTTPPTTRPLTTLAPTTTATTAAPTTIVTTAAPTTIVTTAAPTTVVTTAAPTTVVTTAAPTTIVTTAAPTTTILTSAAPTTTLTTAAPTTVMTTLAPTTAVPENDLTGCAALWLFDENALDSAGGNDLTSNGPSYSIDRMEGTHSADFFEANSEYFTILDADLDANFPGKNGTAEQSFSIVFWTKVNQLAEVMGFVNKYDSEGNTRSYKIWFDEGVNRICFTIGWNGGANSTTLVYDTAIVTGRWYHVGATYNSADNVFKLRIWDDTAGAFLNVGSPTQSETAGGDMSPDTAPLEIGRFDENNEYCLDGHMDEVAICKVVFSDAQIDCIRQQIYDGSCTTAAPTTTATTAAP